ASTPASYVAFDLLAHDETVLLAEPLSSRRPALAEVAGVAGGHTLAMTPSTEDHDIAARWLDAVKGTGVDGVVAKRWDAPYSPGRRAMVKIKRERTVDCVVAGLRLFRSPDELGSLLLGLYDEAGALHHVGVVASFPRADRAPLLDRLRPLVTTLERHPWEHGFGLEGGALGRLKGTAGRWTPDLPRDWVPLRPEVVCEVAYDALEGMRFRHPARLRRWRLDRGAGSCRLDQLGDP
ncbi:MAG: ATP-dependent DNA ligase, partial [Actinomycetota bacterium]|nr:ATP-dependent DNA ligase [Actinomycetota bacterium]